MKALGRVILVACAVCGWALLGCSDNAAAVPIAQSPATLQATGPAPKLATMPATQAALAPVSPIATKPATRAASRPVVIEDPTVPHLRDTPAYLAEHERILARVREGNVGLVFLGDSITAGWAKQKALWDERFGLMNPANLGIGGDCTQHVLWRIQNGELDNIHPKALALMIGTNNMRNNGPVETAAGVAKIVQTIREKLPETKILLLAIFPREAKPGPLRAKIDIINPIIAKLDDGKMVRFLDIGAKFLEPDGTISKTIMNDSLHLTTKGYQIWADAIQPMVEEMMK